MLQVPASQGSKGLSWELHWTGALVTKYKNLCKFPGRDYEKPGQIKERCLLFGGADLA